MLQGLVLDGAARPPGTPARPLVRAVDGDRTSPLVEATWEEALDRLVAAIERTQVTPRPRRRRLLRRRLAHQREGLPVRQVRAGRPAHRAIDYNGRFCMSSAAAAANRAFGIDRGHAFPLTTSPRPTSSSWSAATRPTPCRRRCSTSPQGRGARRAALVVDPRHTPTAASAALHLQPVPGTDLALANGLLHLALADGLVDEAYVAAAHHRVRRRSRPA